MSLEQYLATPGPPLAAVEVDRSALTTLTSDWANAGFTTRVMRGGKMCTPQALFDEVAAALQFPLYFGESWDALDECVSDLGWLPVQRGFVLVVVDAGRVLEFVPDSMPKFVGSLVHAADEWARPVADGEWWDRPPVPFHVVLQVENYQSLDRWRAAGAELVPLHL